MAKSLQAIKWIERAIGVTLLILIGIAGYHLASARLEVDIYRDRLAGLSQEYRSLRDEYNEAVRKTAVTELIVRDNALSVLVRTVEGVQRRIDTPFDPSDEIYCDFVLLDGRLWIRRIYDARTPPSQGLLIDSGLAEVDWSDPAARYGNAVYRSLGEGRWVVTVTGDGSLGLARVDDRAEVTLSGPPPVRDYDEIRKDIDDTLSRITPTELVKKLFTAGR